MRFILALTLAAAPALAQNYEKRVMVDPEYVPSMPMEKIDEILSESDWKVRRAERRAHELELAQARAREAEAYYAAAYEPVYSYDYDPYAYEPSYAYTYASYAPTWGHTRSHYRHHYGHHYRHHYGRHRYYHGYDYRYPAYGYGVRYHRHYRSGTFPTFTVLGGLAGGIIGHQSREAGVGIALGAGLGLLTDAIFSGR